MRSTGCWTVSLQPILSVTKPLNSRVPQVLPPDSQASYKPVLPRQHQSSLRQQWRLVARRRSANSTAHRQEAGCEEAGDSRVIWFTISDGGVTLGRKGVQRPPVVCFCFSHRSWVSNQCFDMRWSSEEAIQSMLCECNDMKCEIVAQARVLAKVAVNSAPSGRQYRFPKCS